MRKVVGTDGEITNIYLTSEILNIALDNQGKDVVAHLILNGLFATHFLERRGKWLYDMGIDSQLIKTTPEEFESRYEGNEWILESII
jgi:hypothetical protein